MHFSMRFLQSQEQGFLGTVAQWVVYWTSALNRCTETGNGRVGHGHRERKYRHYTVRDLDGGVDDEKGQRE